MKFHILIVFIYKLVRKLVIAMAQDKVVTQDKDIVDGKMENVPQDKDTVYEFN